MKLAICDDNIEIVDFLEQEINLQYESFYVISKYTDPEELLDAWTTPKNLANILIMDIKFQEHNGVDIAKQIQEKYGTHIKIIFITGYPEHASEIFRAQPTFLLMKPVSSELLFEALDKATALVKEESIKSIYITFRGCTKKIRADEIYYLESIRKKVVIHFVTGSEESIQKLNEIEKQLPDYFVRIHQSFLINMNFIKTISAYTVEMANGKKFPISRSRAKYVKEKFMEFL